MSKALVYGDSINTDLIIPGKYTKTLDFNELASHCMEDLDPSFRQRIQPGDILVAGYNFGCGSSREQAPVALKYAGVRAVLAKSFARIFYRNAINVGIPVLVCDTTEIQDGDELSVNLDQGVVTVNRSHTLPCQQLSPIMQSILQHGGLVPFLKEKGDFVL